MAFSRQRPAFGRAVLLLCGITRLADDLRFLVYLLKLAESEVPEDVNDRWGWGRWGSIDHALFLDRLVPAYLWEARRFITAAAGEIVAVAGAVGRELVRFAETDDRLTEILDHDRSRLMASSLFLYDLRPSPEAMHDLLQFLQEPGETFDSSYIEYPGLRPPIGYMPVCNELIGRCDAVYEAAAKKWPDLPPWQRSAADPGREMLQAGAALNNKAEWTLVPAPLELVRQALATTGREASAEGLEVLIVRALETFLSQQRGGTDKA